MTGTADRLMLLPVSGSRPGHFVHVTKFFPLKKIFKLATPMLLNNEDGTLYESEISCNRTKLRGVYLVPANPADTSILGRSYRALGFSGVQKSNPSGKSLLK